MPDPQPAHGIWYSIDGAGTLTLHLVDDAGSVFAVAHIPAFGVDPLLDFLIDNYCPDDDDEIGPVVGHA